MRPVIPGVEPMSRVDPIQRMVDPRGSDIWEGHNPIGRTVDDNRRSGFGNERRICCGRRGGSGGWRGIVCGCGSLRIAAKKVIFHTEADPALVVGGLGGCCGWDGTGRRSGHWDGSGGRQRVAGVTRRRRNRVSVDLVVVCHAGRVCFSVVYAIHRLSWWYCE